MKHLYEIVYLVRDHEDECYYPEYSKLIETVENEAYIIKLLTQWNKELIERNISGRFIYNLHDPIIELNDDTFKDIMNDLKEL